VALVVALCGGLCAAAPAHGQCFLSYAWTVSEDDNLLRRVSLDGLAVEETIAIDVPGQVVTGITGVAIEPSTGEIWLLLYFGGVPGSAPFLAHYDPVNAFTTVVGSTFVNFVTLAFEPTGVLYSVSADTANPANSFCTLDLVTAAPVDICTYGAGDDGEAIAHHPGEDRMYHASGAMDVVFETEDPAGLEPCDALAIDVSTTPLVGAEVTGIAWWPSENAFLWARTAGGASTFYRVSATGAVTSIGTIGHAASDIAIVEVATPCPPGGDFIRGDSNQDSAVNIADVVFSLNAQFVPGSPQPQCPDSADYNDDGATNIADAVYLLNRLFVSGSPAPPPPFPTCGPDGTTADPLDCPQYPCP